MTITVSALSLSDRAQWEKLYRGYAGFYQMPMEQKTLDQIWQWIFDSQNRFFALMAKDECGIGIGLMHYREMPSPLRGAAVGFLDDLYIDPACRGEGVVDQLFGRLKEEAQLNNWPFVRWITAENNYRGRAAYDRLSDKTQWLTYQMNAN